MAVPQLNIQMLILNIHFSLCMLVLTFKNFDIFSSSPINQFFLHPLVYRSCKFSRVIKQYVIHKNDFSNNEKMLQTNRQTLQTNDTSFSFRGQSRVHAKQCKGSSNRDITISYPYMNAPLNVFNELSMSKRQLKSTFSSC